MRTKFPRGMITRQTVGNIGLYYTCYKLSLYGWNVMPTARNAKDIDRPLPEKCRTLITKYIKDYVSLNRFAA